jgi:hypothetical protein
VQGADALIQLRQRLVGGGVLCRQVQCAVPGRGA